MGLTLAPANTAELKHVAHIFCALLFYTSENVLIFHIWCFWLASLIAFLFSLHLIIFSLLSVFSARLYYHEFFSPSHGNSFAFSKTTYTRILPSLYFLNILNVITVK